MQPDGEHQWVTVPRGSLYQNAMRRVTLVDAAPRGFGDKSRRADVPLWLTFTGKNPTEMIRARPTIISQTRLWHDWASQTMARSRLPHPPGLIPLLSPACCPRTAVTVLCRRLIFNQRLCVECGPHGSGPQVSDQWDIRKPSWRRAMATLPRTNPTLSFPTRS